jgi:REP element-mobilizing transposase RayT
MTARTHDPIFEVPQLREILYEQWRALPDRFPGVTIDEFVVMPDHVHGILFLDGLVDSPPTLGRVIGAYKSLTTAEWFKYSKSVGMDAIGPFWLRNYYERVIRDNDELEQVRGYIRHNPEKLETREY